LVINPRPFTSSVQVHLLCSKLSLAFSTGMQYLLPTTWTAVKGLGVDLLHLSQLLSTNPAHLAGLGSKGRLAKGMDADIVVSGRAKVGSKLHRLTWVHVHC
jgi:alpha-D-ribose 1-methylphosphonate 5-triphosphate diphosphatase PhnM